MWIGVVCVRVVVGLGPWVWVWGWACVHVCYHQDKFCGFQQQSDEVSRSTHRLIDMARLILVTSSFGCDVVAQ